MKNTTENTDSDKAAKNGLPTQDETIGMLIN